MVRLSRVGSVWNRDTRNRENDDKKIIEDFINGKSNEVYSEEITQKMLDDVKLKYETEVPTVADLPVSDEENTIRGVVETNKLYIYDGERWIQYLTSDPNKINQVEDSITSEMDSISLNAKRLPEGMESLIGDGATIETAKLTTALEYLEILPNGGELVLPRGEYIVDNTISIKNNVTLKFSKGAIVIYDGTSEKAVDVNTGGKIVNPVIKKLGEWNINTPLMGLVFSGSGGIGENVTVEGFEDGLVFLGDGQGSAYNHVTVKEIKNCLASVVFKAKNGGWSNENTTYAGRVWVNSSLHNTLWEEHSWGVKFDNESTHQLNGNKMFAPSIESVNHGILISGQHNNIFGPRLEMPGDLKLYFKSHNGVEAYNNSLYGYWGGASEYGLNIIMERPDGTQAESLFDNAIYGIKDFPFVLNGDLQFQAADYRYPKMRYNHAERTLDLEEAGAIKVKIGLGSNSKHDLGLKESQNFILEKRTWANRPTNAKDGQVFFVTDKNKPAFFSANLQNWVDGAGNEIT